MVLVKLVKFSINKSTTNHISISFHLASVRPSCRRNEDCDADELCDHGNCRKACDLRPCGYHAYCQALNHQATCICNEGYDGNDPTFEGCSKCKILIGCLCMMTSVACFLFQLCLPAQSCWRDALATQNVPNGMHVRTTNASILVQSTGLVPKTPSARW